MSIFGDTSWVNEEYAEVIVPPTVQWRRGDLTNPNPLLKNGCWQLPADSFEMIAPPDWKAVDVLHGGGVVVSSYLLPTIHIAVLAWRKRWFMVDDGGNYTYLDDYQDGAKSKLQYYALLKELGNEPVLISVSGMNSKYLSEAFYEFRQKVIRQAGQLARQRFGYHHFWMPVSTTGKRDTNHNQYITPPGLAMADFDKETLRSLFTGREAADAAEALIPEARAWAKAKEESAPSDNGQTPPPNFADDDFTPEPEPTLTEDEIPF